MSASTTRAPRVFLTLFLFFSSLVAGLSIERAITCNGHTELCSRSYGNVTFVGAHNSYAVGSSNIAANQDYNVTQQLNDGIRLLQNQVHKEDDGIHLCHTICPLYDAGLLVNYLVAVRKWLEANPGEVVTLLLVNIDNVPVVEFAEIYNSAGLSSVSFVPTTPTLTIDQWPTLGSMIASGQRLVTFMDNGADAAKAPYLLDEFTNVWETAFDVTTQDFLCDVNRTRGDPTTKLYLINHFLDEFTTIAGTATTIAPAKDKLNVTNAATGFGSLGFEVENCVASHGVPPNFLLVDFYNYGEGSVFDVAAQLNGVPAPSSKPAPPIINATEEATVSSGVVNVRPLKGAGVRLAWSQSHLGAMILVVFALLAY